MNGILAPAYLPFGTFFGTHLLTDKVSYRRPLKCFWLSNNLPNLSLHTTLTPRWYCFSIENYKFLQGGKYNPLGLFRIWLLQKKLWETIFPIIFDPTKISWKCCPKIQPFKIATKHFKFIKGLPERKFDNFVFWILRCEISKNHWFKSHSWISLIETLSLIPILLLFMTFYVICHKMTYVIWHKMLSTIAIWVSNEPSQSD